MAKQTLVNRETNKNVTDFIDKIENKNRQTDSRALLSLIAQITGKDAKIWGKNIVGFGKYKYQRKNGQEFEWFNVGFSPGKVNLTLYVMYDINSEEELLKQLGPHKTGKGCLYMNRLEQIDLKVLEKLIAKSDKWCG